MELGEVLLVGSTGYLGSHLARALDLDVLERDEVMRLSKEQVFDTIIHAAHFKDLDGEKEFISSLPDDCYFVFFSSAAVYGNTSLDGASVEDEVNPINDYGVYKLELEKLIRTKFHRHLILRISNPYGKENRSGGVYQYFKAKLAANESLQLYANHEGELVRDFIYIDDFLTQVLDLLRVEAHGTYNISSGQGIKLEDFAKEINTDLKPRFKYLGSRQGEIRVSVLRPSIHQK